MASSQNLSNLTMLVPVLKGAAIAGSFRNAGVMTMAHDLLPSIYPLVSTSPKLALQQWKFSYDLQSQIVPLTDLATIAACGGLAYLEHKTDSQGLAWKLWAGAAGLMPVGWLYVWVVMLEPSNKLVALATATESALEEKKAGTIDALQKFNGLMTVRMAIPWVVGGLAIAASLAK
ncbi:hypothetical protein LTR62_006049 [Meristemomyces frigidus]|uniref:DUF1772-domain-containing protein n=1 Tax=Meristemomyces frigidus TaxID=1508187 RepID=A0AAN7TDG3_9PEZI|nr:hypothetical protein LTR62_006049 [Meristemomyces frigidus]